MYETACIKDLSLYCHQKDHSLAFVEITRSEEFKCAEEKM